VFGVITIVGLGLIGGSYGLAIRERKLAERVIGVSRRETTLAAALRCGACDEATDDLIAGSHDADLIILCAPVTTISERAAMLADVIPPECVVTDAGSTKATLVRQCEIALAGKARFVGGHPMAGSELTGIAHARADLFAGAIYALTRTQHTDDAAFTLVHDFARALGAKPLTIDPAVHDEVVALTSHLPHAVAFALASAVWGGHPNKSALASLAASGYRDTTRLAGASPELWCDIFTANRDALLHAFDGFQSELSALRAALAAGDDAALLRALKQANERRASLLRSIA